MSNSYNEKLQQEYISQVKLVEQSLNNMNYISLRSNLKILNKYNSFLKNIVSNETYNSLQSESYNKIIKPNFIQNKVNNPNFHLILERLISHIDYKNSSMDSFDSFLVFYLQETKHSKNTYKVLNTIFKNNENNNYFNITTLGKALMKNNHEEVFSKCLPLFKKIINANPHVYNIKTLFSMLQYKNYGEINKNIPDIQKKSLNSNNFILFYNTFLNNIFKPPINSIKSNSHDKVSFAYLFFGYLNNSKEVDFNEKDQKNLDFLFEQYKQHHKGSDFISCVVDLSFQLFLVNSKKEDLTKWIEFAIKNQEHDKTYALFKKLDIPTNLFSEFNNFYTLNTNLPINSKKTNHRKI